MPQTDYENNLINSLIKGDIFSFEEVFKKYNKKIYHFSLKYLKNKEDAEGVVQEVFLSLWANREGLKKDSNLNAYLFTITFNAIRKRFRKLSREKQHLDEYTLIMKDTHREVHQDEFFDVAEKANHIVAKLPLQQKKVFLLNKEKGYTTSEIAEELHLTKKTIENHLHRARSFIRKTMAEEGLLTILFFVLFLD